jgi:calcium/calmodulin dependent protein kinase II association protein
MSDDLRQEVLAANARLLAAIADGDWTTYAELCDPTISAFEPESRGHLVEGLPFHRFYFDLGGIQGPHNTTMSSPHVRLLPGEVAVLSYVRLVQKLAADGGPLVTGAEETRVWQRQAGRWQHVHFHRTPIA